MKRLRALLPTLLLLAAAPALAHVGPEDPELHFLEHLLIALAIALPVGYGVLRFVRRGSQRR